MLMQPKRLYKKKTFGLTRATRARAQGIGFSAAQSAIIPRNRFAPEMKFVDLTYGPVAINTTVQFGLLNGLVPGSLRYQRVGSRIVITRLQVNFDIAPAAASANYVDDTPRVCIIFDKNPAGANPTWAQMYQDTLTAGGQVSNSLSNPNPDNMTRFTIVRDYRFSGVTALSPSPAASAVGQINADYNSWKMMSRTVDIKMKKMCRYNTGTAGTIADLTEGALYVTALGILVGAAAAYNLNFTSRVSYFDA